MVKFVVSKKEHSPIYRFFPFAVLITLMCGLLFVTLQQTLRLGANEPLIQLALELSNRLSKEPEIPHQFPTNKIDISKSLSTFFYVYDANKQFVGTTASINGEEIQIPHGLLEVARKNGQRRVTWQPTKNVRAALVVVHFKDQSEGFVAVGRNLEETELLIYKIQILVGLGWLATLLFVFASWYMARKLH